MIGLMRLRGRKADISIIATAEKNIWTAIARIAIRR